jgi:pimeloyl-ACP methyl ester carboxylesterase
MITTDKLKTQNFVFDVRTAGDPSHPLVILMHGFPETNHMWITLMKTLSEKGYFCVAPNMRGYSPGARPKGKNQYRVDMLQEDIDQMRTIYQKEKFHLVGHDWGAAVGWKYVHDHPNNILSWSGLSVPHLQSFGHAITHDQVQHKMSAYIRRFQLPWLPEMQIRKNDFAIFKKFWKYSSEEEMQDYLGVFRQKGALTAALNYYRGNYPLLKQAGSQQMLGEITVPTLFIWGEKDIAISAAAVEGGHQYMKGPYEFVKIEGGHWLIQTHFDQVSQAIVKHIKQYS